MPSHEFGRQDSVSRRSGMPGHLRYRVTSHEEHALMKAIRLYGVGGAESLRCEEAQEPVPKDEQGPWCVSMRLRSRRRS